MRLSLALVLAAMLSLCSCATSAGVQRAVKLRGRVPHEVILAAIKDVPGVEVARYRHLPPTIGYGRVEFTNVSTDQYVFISQARQVDGVLEIGGNDREGLRLRMYCLWGSGNPPAAQVAETRKLMDEVYASLHRRAPELVPPRERVQEEVR